MEHVLVALWRSADVDAVQCHERVLGEWAKVALEDPTVQACTVSVAETDQGIYANPPDAHGLVPNCDVLVALGLERAHDLDDAPERDLLYALAARSGSGVSTCTNRLCGTTPRPTATMLPVSSSCRSCAASKRSPTRASCATGPNGTHPSPRNITSGCGTTAKMSCGARSHPAVATSTALRSCSSAAARDFDTLFFDSDEGRAVIMADVKRFMRRSNDAALMRERPLRTP